MAESGEFSERVFVAVDAIPPGRVMTYGDVAEYADIRSPRTVGQVLSECADGVPWHRVVKAGGALAPHIADEQRQRLLSEGVLFRGARVDLARFRWDGR